MLFLFLFSFDSFSKVILIKQWHLSPKAQTLDIEKSKKRPQFVNQVDIYKYLLSQYKNKKISLILSEGCEGEITNKFNLAHNGWSYKKLHNKINDPIYKDILALVPLKVKVKLGNKIKVLCGDSSILMEQNALAFSELRGFSNFAIALIQAKKKKNTKKFELYKKTLFQGEKNPKKLDAISFAKLKASESLSVALKLIKARNDKFIDVIKKNKSSNMAVVIGGLHVDDLSMKLKKLNIPYEVYTPKGYKNVELSLLQTLNKFLK